MNSDLLIYSFATIILVGLVGVCGFYSLNSIYYSLNSIDNSLEELSTDSSYLYYQISKDNNIFRDGVLYSKVDGKSIVGLHRNNYYIYLNTRNRSDKQVCLTFLHELGHKVCHPDLNEACANNFKKNNLNKCAMLNNNIELPQNPSDLSEGLE